MTRRKAQAGISQAGKIVAETWMLSHATTA